MGTLKQFVDTYLANKRIEDYESWVAAYGKDTEKRYAEAMAAADSGYAKDLATYGSRADKLLARGLTGSGYSDYLSGKAMESYAKARSEALTAKETADAENKQGYARYLRETEDKTKEEAEGIYKNAITSLFAKNFAEEDAAVAYLSAFGIEGDVAKSIAAARPVLKEKDEGQADVLSHCIAYRYTREQAYIYAKGCGLSDENAQAVASATEVFCANYQK